MKRIIATLAVLGSLFGTAAVTATAASASTTPAAPYSWYHG
jgi:hypothetical protein